MEKNPATRQMKKCLNRTKEALQWKRLGSGKKMKSLKTMTADTAAEASTPQMEKEAAVRSA